MSPMNNRLMVPTQPPGILDFAPGAAAAYSLRNLSRSYAGPVVTVRRSSDDAEADFTAAEVADGTLAAFCGAGDGLVKQWWDQSGNTRHVTQSTSSKQPAVVSSGVLETYDGKPALYFDGVDDTLERDASFLGADDFTVISLQAFANDPLSATAYVSYYGNANANIQYAAITYQISEAKYTFRCRTSFGSDGVAASLSTTDAYGILFCTRAGTVGNCRFNATSEGDVSDSDFGVSVAGTLVLMSFRDVAWSEGHMQEHIIWLRDLADQAELIEGNIAWSFSQ